MPVIRGEDCINLTQIGLKHVGFIPKPAYPEAVIRGRGLCIGERLHKSSPQGGLQSPHPEEAFNLEVGQANLHTPTSP